MPNNVTGKNIIIISSNSGIGEQLALNWVSCGNTVTGSYRKLSESDQARFSKLIALHHLDLLDGISLQNFVDNSPEWDVLILCSGTMDPIGKFDGINIENWKQSVSSNFIAQIELVYRLLPKRRLESVPAVIFFAGGGTNSATVNYSAYTVSKIALIKMVELLDAEILDTKFVILGPGWVKTKIHEETLKAGESAGDSYQVTLQKLESGEGFTPMSRIQDFCDWIIESPREAVSGRNFSIVNDEFGNKLIETLIRDNDKYKLRRHGN